MPLTDEELVQLISQATEFPKLSSEAAEVARLASDLSAPVKEVAELISADPSMQALILEIINTGLYGIQDPVDRVDQAVQLLGYKKLCNLAVCLSLVRQFPKEKGGLFDYHLFWERAVCYGVAAAVITSKLPSDLPVDTFSIGLMMDVGSLFLVQHRPLEYGAALGVAKGKDAHMVLAEQEAIGVDHAKIGGLLARKWKLPKIMGDAILSHHFYETEKKPAAGIKTILQVVNLAALFPEVVLDGDRSKREEINKRAKEFLNLGPKAVDAIINDMAEPLQNVAKALEIQMGSVALAEEAEAATVSAEPVKCTECNTENASGARFCSNCGTPLARKVAVKRPPSNRILVAEDSTASRRALCFFIKKLGFVPVEATNGYEAYDLARKNPPGMILLDIMMPVMSGLEALVKIRGDASLEGIPIIMLTSLTDNETVIEAVQAGANDYVVKPYTADIISERVEKFMPKPEKKPSEKY